MLAWYGMSDVELWAEQEFGLPWQKPGKYVAASPLVRVGRVTTPTLVLCGKEDMRTPLGQSEQCYRALRRVGVEAQLVIYPGEGHSPSPGSWADVRERGMAWFARLLQPKSERSRSLAAAAGSAGVGGGQ
jgi:dipeptidyl aminopeptidase/acylaminoacyl peptidase